MVKARSLGIAKSLSRLSSSEVEVSLGPEGRGSLALDELEGAPFVPSCRNSRTLSTKLLQMNLVTNSGGRSVRSVKSIVKYLSLSVILFCCLLDDLIDYGRLKLELN
jgi:hypothetical protein